MTMNRIALCSLAALMLAACSKEEAPGLDGRQELRLTSGIEAVTRGDVQNTQIVVNEKVWAWVSDAGNGAALYNAEQLTVGANGALTGTTAMYFPQTGNAVNIRALHGTFTETFSEGETAFPASIGFAVAETQNGSGSAYVQSDLLYAAQTAAKTKTAVQLKFYHMLSKLELNITKDPTVTDEIKSVTLDGVAIDGTFTPGTTADISEQTTRAAMVKASNQTETMTLGTSTTGSNDAIVVPQATGGKTITFTLNEGGKLYYTFPEGKAFESGKKHVYNVKLTLTGIEVESSIEPWDTSEGATDGDTTFSSAVKIGDYFYSDGTFSTDLDPDKTVIGIVFQTNPRRIGQAERDALTAKGVTEPHGLVMSIKNAATQAAWGNYGNTALGECETVADCYKDISGLKNTTTLGARDDLPAFKAIANFNTDNPVPSNATQWFLPSAGQLWDLIEIFGKVTALAAQRTNSGNKWSGTDSGNNSCYNLDSWLVGVENAEQFGWEYFSLWSSTEYAANQAWSWTVRSSGTVFFGANNKPNKFNVRPILAF